MTAVLYEDLASAHNDMANSAGYLSDYYDFGVNRLPQYAVQHMCQVYREKGFIPEPNENMVYAKLIELPADAKANSRNLSTQYSNKAAQIKQRKKAEQERIAKEAAKKRFDDYWSSHSEQKVELLKEKDSLNVQLSEYQREHNSISSDLAKKLRSASDDKEIKDIDSQLSQLYSRIASLGLFKGREKKAIQEQIDQLRNKRCKLVDSMDATKKSIQNEIDNEKREYERKTEPMRTRLKDIENELNKPR